MKRCRSRTGDGAPLGGGRNPSRDFGGERRRNATHWSTTDPDALLYRNGPGTAARLCFGGYVLMENRFVGYAFMENRSGLVVDAELTRASGHGSFTAQGGCCQTAAA